jgi:flagellar hook-basal body complex protein FliE
MVGIPFNHAAGAYSAISKIGGTSDANDSSATSSDSATNGSAPAGSPSFGALVGEALSRARNDMYTTESLSAGAVANKTQLHELVTAVSGAELTLQAVIAIRDKMINAYQDILKMPI